jgi:hypothetical protein
MYRAPVRAAIPALSINQQANRKFLMRSERVVWRHLASPQHRDREPATNYRLSRLLHAL